MVPPCPHALGVAIPLVISIWTALSATYGLLVLNRTAFENAPKLRTIIFDKAGNLTKGSHEIQQIFVEEQQFSTDQTLQYAAAVQQNAGHHIAHE